MHWIETFWGQADGQIEKLLVRGASTGMKLEDVEKRADQEIEEEWLVQGHAGWEYQSYAHPNRESCCSTCVGLCARKDGREGKTSCLPQYCVILVLSRDTSRLWALADYRNPSGYQVAERVLAVRELSSWRQRRSKDHNRGLESLTWQR